MPLTRFALANRTLLFVLIGLLTLAGIQTYLSLPRDESPAFTIRTAVVAVIWPGASAERMERLVAEPLEEALEELPGAKHVQTVVQPGRVVVSLDVEDTLPEVEPAWTEMRETVADVAQTLPQGVIGPFVNDDFGDVYGQIIAVTGEGFAPDELERAAETLRRRLLALPDARRVQIDGAREQRAFVTYDPARLAGLGVPAGVLIGQLQQRNLVAPGGDVSAGGRTIPLRPAGAFASVDDLRETTLRLPTGALVTLGDLAEVEMGYADPPSQIVRYSGADAVTVAVSMKADGRLTQFGPDVLRVVEETRADLPAGLGFDVVIYQPEVVDRLTSEFVVSLVQAVLIVVLVLLVSLGFRTGLIVSSVIPITMFVSFLCMALFDITINQMSLVALIIALGLLVDNSIVVSEQILSDVKGGADLREASVQAARAMAFPLLVASASTVGALLPTYLAETSASEYTAAIFEVLAFSLAVSWVLSMTMIPVLCVLFLKTGHDASEQDRTPLWRRLGARLGLVSAEAPPEDDEAFGGALYRRYRAALVPMLRHKWLTLAGFSGAFVLSLVGFGIGVPQQFFPTKQYEVFVVELDFPWGTSVEETDRVAGELGAFLSDSLSAQVEREPGLLASSGAYGDDGVVRWASYAGSAAPRYTLSYAPEAPRPDYAYLIVTGTTAENQPETFGRIQRFMERAHPSVVTRAQRVRNGPAIDYPFEVRISGEDPAVLKRLAADVRRELSTIEGAVNVGTDWGAQQASLDVVIDHDAARRAGLSTADVSFSLQSALDGIPVSTLQLGSDDIPVVFRSTEARSGVDALSRMDIYSGQTGQSVPLSQVADVRVAYEPANIERYDGVRTITVEADVSEASGPFVTMFTVQAALEDYLAEATPGWPAGYTYAYGGDIEQSVDSQSAIGAKGPLAIVVILLFLVAQFNALRPVAIVLISLPFAMIGVTLGLVVSGYAFGFMPLLGTIALFGIIINNAVVLLDRVDGLRASGMEARQALVHAAQQRFRPILLTAATTAGGLLPLWMAGSPLFAPMAVAMLFGLVASSALTPGLVPALYALFYRLDFSDFSYDPDASAEAPETDDGQSVSAPDAADGDGSITGMPALA